MCVREGRGREGRVCVREGRAVRCASAGAGREIIDILGKIWKIFLHKNDVLGDLCSMCV